MTLKQYQITPATGDRINRLIKEAIDDLGYPFYHNYFHGLHINMPTDDYSFNEAAGTIQFSFRGYKVFELTLAYLAIVESKPPMLIMDVKLCLEIVQKRDKTPLGWLYWSE